LRTVIDPSPQDSNFRGIQWLTFGRHPHVFIESRHELDERALSALARNNVWRVRFAVAFAAVILQDGLNVFYEVH
jgi:hypothetical protein